MRLSCYMPEFLYKCTTFKRPDSLCNLRLNNKSVEDVAAKA